VRDGIEINIYINNKVRVAGTTRAGRRCVREEGAGKSVRRNHPDRSEESMTTSEKVRDRDTRCNAWENFTHVVPHCTVATTGSTRCTMLWLDIPLVERFPWFLAYRGCQMDLWHFPFLSLVSPHLLSSQRVQ